MPPDANLASRMDESLKAFWGAYALADDSQTEELPGALFLCTPIPLYLFNTVILTGQDRTAIDAAFKKAADWIADQGRPVLWRVSTTAASEDVRSLLEQLGLESHGRDPAMLADLSSISPMPQIEGFSIQTVRGGAERYDWAWLTCNAFELDADVCEAMSNCEAGIPESLHIDQPRYIGCLDGKAIAVSSLVMAAGLAGVYAVATLPEVRTRGIGTAMTLHAMAEGKRRGAKSAVLQATEMGKSVYEKIGFSTIFDYELYLQS